MTEGDALSPGDEWTNHYRGLSLQVTPDGNTWWQLYNGTDRLTLEPAPERIIEQLLELKRIGGRMHVTEQGDVLTKIEADDGYDQVYVGTVDSLDGDLIPRESPEYGINLQPQGLSPGDLWPSVYDGSRYSFSGDRYWWHSSHSHKRHTIPDGLPGRIEDSLRQYKPEGGSFRVLPWGDIITLVSSHPRQQKVSRQFNDLPRVVRNIIKLRKERDVEMLPIYVGTLEECDIAIKEPTSLTDSLSEEEKKSLSSWAENLGQTSDRETKTHRTGNTGSTGNKNSRSSTNAASAQSGDIGADDSPGSTKSPTDKREFTGQHADEVQTDDKHSPDDGGIDVPEIDDDPLEWMRKDIESIEDNKNDEGSS